MTTDWPTAFAQALREVDPTVDADKAEAAMRWALDNSRATFVDDSGFERDDVDMGRSADDDEQADRAADREWAARWER